LALQVYLPVAGFGQDFLLFHAHQQPLPRFPEVEAEELLLVVCVTGLFAPSYLSKILAQKEAQGNVFRTTEE
jgi:hypothetical protein